MYHAVCIGDSYTHNNVLHLFSPRFPLYRLYFLLRLNFHGLPFMLA